MYQQQKKFYLPTYPGRVKADKQVFDNGLRKQVVFLYSNLS